MGVIYFKGTPEDNHLGHIMAELYKEEIYSPILMGKKNLTIFDIGANIGLTAILFSKYAKDVYSVEPAKEHFETLKQNIEGNELTNVHALNYAIGNENKDIELQHFANKTAFNVLNISPGDQTGRETVKMITIDKLFEITGVKKVDFMKLDTEGAEFVILGGLGFKKVAPLIDSILVEMHEWTGRNFNQIKDSLKVNGFKTQEIVNDAHLIYAHK